MPLNLNKLFPQVGSMISRLKDDGIGWQERLKCAQKTLRAEDADRLADKIKASKTTWLVAGIVDGLDKAYPPPPVPDDFSVLATDGSHIAVDRHR